MALREPLLDTPVRTPTETNHKQPHGHHNAFINIDSETEDVDASRRQVGAAPTSWPPESRRPVQQQPRSHSSRNIVFDDDDDDEVVGPVMPLKELNDALAPTPLMAAISFANSLRWKRPKRISKYVLGPLLGEGSFGHVRDAIDFSSTAADRVAVKTIGCKYRREVDLKRIQEVLENETEHLQRYHHPNVSTLR